MASEGEALLEKNNLQGAFNRFKRFKAGGPRITAPIRDANGSLLSDLPRMLERWKGYFKDLLNRPPAVFSPLIDADVSASVPSDLVCCSSPTQTDISNAISRLKNGKAPGICKISPEMLKYGEPLTSSALLPLFDLIWNTEEIPEDWRRGIILPLYKGKGNRSEGGNYRGITLLSVPGEVFARVLLERMRLVIPAKRRREQSGFTPGRSTVDRILPLTVLAQTRREYRPPLYAAYIDLTAAFDSVDRDALFKLLEMIGIPLKLIRLFRGLYTETVSCVQCEGELSQWFQVKSGVRQGCFLAPDAFNVAMDRIFGCTVSGTHLGSSIGEDFCSDFDVADDAAILAEVFDTLILALSVFEERRLSF